MILFVNSLKRDWIGLWNSFSLLETRFFSWVLELVLAFPLNYLRLFANYLNLFDDYFMIIRSLFLIIRNLFEAYLIIIRNLFDHYSSLFETPSPTIRSRMFKAPRYRAGNFWPFCDACYVCEPV